MTDLAESFLAEVTAVQLKHRNIRAVNSVTDFLVDVNKIADRYQAKTPDDPDHKAKISLLAKQAMHGALERGLSVKGVPV